MTSESESWNQMRFDVTPPCSNDVIPSTLVALSAVNPEFSTSTFPSTTSLNPNPSIVVYSTAGVGVGVGVGGTGVAVGVGGAVVAVGGASVAAGVGGAVVAVGGASVAVEVAVGFDTSLEVAAGADSC